MQQIDLFNGSSLPDLSRSILIRRRVSGKTNCRESLSCLTFHGSHDFIRIRSKRRHCSTFEAVAIKFSRCVHDSSCESAALESEGDPKGKQRNSSMSRRRYPEWSPNAGTLTRESGTGIEDTCGVYMIRYGRRNSVIKLIALPYVPGGPAIKGAKFLAKKSREGIMQPPPRYALRQNFGQGNGYRRKATPRIDAAR